MKFDKILGAFSITTCSMLIAMHCCTASCSQMQSAPEVEAVVQENIAHFEYVEEAIREIKAKESMVKIAADEYRLSVMTKEAIDEANLVKEELKLIEIEEVLEETERIEDERASVEEVENQKYKVYDEVPLDEETQIALFENCDEYGAPYHIILGIIQAESTFRPYARNGNCVGYMQVNHINDGWLKNIGVTNIEDPFQNLKAGIYIISDFYNRYGDWHKALMCYNCGEGGAGSLFRSGYYSSVYSRTVMKYAESWATIVYGK